MSGIQPRSQAYFFSKYIYSSADLPKELKMDGSSKRYFVYGPTSCCFDDVIVGCCRQKTRNGSPYHHVKKSEYGLSCIQCFTLFRCLSNSLPFQDSRWSKGSRGSCSGAFYCFGLATPAAGILSVQFTSCGLVRSFRDCGRQHGNIARGIFYPPNFRQLGHWGHQLSDRGAVVLSFSKCGVAVVLVVVTLLVKSNFYPATSSSVLRV